MQSLIDLLKAKPYQHTYEIKGVKFTLRMLTRKEYDDVMSRASISTEDIVSKEALLRRPVLGYALQEINGANVKDIVEVKKLIDESNGLMPVNIAVERVLGDLDAFYVDALYALYDKLVEDNDKSREELKKD